MFVCLFVCLCVRLLVLASERVSGFCIVCVLIVRLLVRSFAYLRSLFACRCETGALRGILRITRGSVRPSIRSLPQCLPVRRLVHASVRLCLVCALIQSWVHLCDACPLVGPFARPLMRALRPVHSLVCPCSSLCPLVHPSFQLCVRRYARLSFCPCARRNKGNHRRSHQKYRDAKMRI